MVPSLRNLLSTFGLQVWGLHPRRMASGASSFTFLLRMASVSTTGSQRRSFHSITLLLMMLSGCSSHGVDCLMAKVDLKSAFCMVPVRAEDWDLLGMFWQGRYYVDTCLPFGLRSAPYLLNQLAEALHWILSSQHSVEAIHYLDYFLLVGPAGQQQCATSVQSTLSVCGNLGIPLSLKILGVTKELNFARDEQRDGRY